MNEEGEFYCGTEPEDVTLQDLFDAAERAEVRAKELKEAHHER